MFHTPLIDIQRVPSETNNPWDRMTLQSYVKININAQKNRRRRAIHSNELRILHIILRFVAKRVTSSGIIYKN